MEQNLKEHIHADGTVHTHSGGGHPHSHVHDPAEKKRQINRLARVIGHMQHVRKMIENDEDCRARGIPARDTEIYLNNGGSADGHRI